MKMKLEDLSKSNAELDKVYEIEASDPLLGGEHKKFKIMKNLNRSIDPKHVGELRSVLEKNPASWRDFAPIEVNRQTFNILDGQHRWAAFASLSEEARSRCILKVLFCDVAAEDEARIVLEKNTSSRNWKTSDYAKRNLDKNNAVQKFWDDFCASHEKCFTINKNSNTKTLKREYGAALLWGHAPSAKNIKTGDFMEFDCSQLTRDEADERYNDLETLIGTLWPSKKTGTWYGRLARAWYWFKKSRSNELLRVGGLPSFITPSIGEFEGSETSAEDWRSWLDNELRVCFCRRGIKLPPSLESL